VVTSTIWVKLSPGNSVSSTGDSSYSEVEGKGYHLVTPNAPDLRPNLSDVDVEFRVSPTRRMVELRAVY
jgi:hypothetical protein